MPALVIGGVTVPVAPGGISRPRMDMADRARAFDGTYRASVTGNPKRDWILSTPPVPRSTADLYELVLGLTTPQLCSGDILGNSSNLVLQSENFGTTWAVVATPTRTAAAHTASGITLDLLGDDNAGAAEGYSQVIAFTGNAAKVVSLFVKEGSSTSSVFHLVDSTAPATRLLAALTWSAGLPVVAMTTGTLEGYDTLADGVFRIRMVTTSVTAANTNTLNIYPANTAAGDVTRTGQIYAGGVQAENALVSMSYVRTTTASVLGVNCCSEITGWTPVKLSTGHSVVLGFELHEI